jgi:hypothetical protein
MKVMKQIEVNPMRLLAGACVLFALLALAPAVVAQQGIPAQSGKNLAQATGQVASPAATTGLTAQPAAMPVTEEETGAPNSPKSQGIKVHGHWVLQVKNADGTPGERREFDNSLVTSGTMMTGDQILAALLSGYDASAFCDNGTGSEAAVPAGIDCFGFYPAGSIFDLLPGGGYQLQSNASQQGQSGLSNLVSFDSPVKIVLSGNFIVPTKLGTEGSISAVQTYAGFCFPSSATYAALRFNGSNLAFLQADFAPKQCIGNPVGEGVMTGTLTSAIIAGGPLPVAAGQTVIVTFTLSFS